MPPRSNHLLEYAGLDFLVGKVNHIAFLIPLACHLFLCMSHLGSASRARLQTLGTKQEGGHDETGTESGVIGDPTASWLALPATSSSILYPTTKNSSSFAPSTGSIQLLNGVYQEDWKEDIQTHWSQALSKLPQSVWLRRFETITNQAPFALRAAKTSYQSFEPSSKPTKT